RQLPSRAMAGTEQGGRLQQALGVARVSMAQRVVPRARGEAGGNGFRGGLDRNARLRPERLVLQHLIAAQAAESYTGRSMTPEGREGGCRWLPPPRRGAEIGPVPGLRVVEGALVGTCLFGSLPVHGITGRSEELEQGRGPTGRPVGEAGQVPERRIARGSPREAVPGPVGALEQLVAEAERPVQQLIVVKQPPQYEHAHDGSGSAREEVVLLAVEGFQPVDDRCCLLQQAPLLEHAPD